MPVHSIRLRGPWQYEPLAWTRRTADGRSETLDRPLPEPGTIVMPADWGATLGYDFRGRVLYRRAFGCPTGLEPDDRVWLVLDQVDGFGDATLNGRRLGCVSFRPEPISFDVTDDLRARNLLEVEVELPEIDAQSAPLPRPGPDGRPGGLTGEARLEIRS